MKFKIAVFLSLSIFLCQIQGMAQNDSAQKWTLKQCLQYGLQNHPLLKIASSNVESRKASLRQTKAYWDPRLDMRASWNRRKIDSGGALDDMVDSTSESVGVSKVLLDSGQNRFEELSARSSVKAAESDRQNTLIEIAANIKKAFFSAQQAQALVQVRQETLDGYQKHLEKVEGYVEVGTRAPYDITRARVDVANAQVELISAKSRLKVALANLARAVGLESEIFVADFEISATPASVSDKEELKNKAFSRPELQSAEFDIDSADARVKGLKRSLKPVVAASADYSWNGTVTPLNRQWSAGVSLNWSLFDGALTRSRIDAAKSQLNSAGEGFRNLKLVVNAELENAITGLEDALERFKATDVAVQQASESMFLAEGRYDAGLGNPIEINDARVEYARARGNFVVAYFDSLIAAAELERVTGELPIEYRIQAVEKDEQLEEENKK
jgi:outer membrane protein TolC